MEYGVFEFRDIVPFLLPLTMSLFAPKILVALKLWLAMMLLSSFIFGMIGFNAAHHHPDIFHDGDIYRFCPIARDSYLNLDLASSMRSYVPHST